MAISSFASRSVSSRSVRLFALAASIAFTFAACRSSDSVGPPGEGNPANVVSVSISRTEVPVVKGSTLPLTVSALDSAGKPVVTDATWTSSAPLVAAVSHDGVVSAVGFGSATVTATIGIHSGSAEVVVTTVPTERAYSVLDLGPALQVGGMTRQLSDSGDVLAGGKLYRSGVASLMAGCPSPVTINGPGHVLCKVNAYDSVSSYAIWHEGTLTPLAAADSFKAEHFRAFALNDSNEVAGLFFMPAFANANCPANGARCLSFWKNGAAGFPGYDAGGKDVMLMNNRQQAVVEYAMWNENVYGSVIYDIPTANSRQTQYGVQAFNKNGWGAIASPWIAHGSSDPFRSKACVPTPTDLIVLGSGKASGNNDSNVVTGTLDVGPFLWRGSGVSLLTHASVDPSWTVTSADEINSRGQILATADNTDGRTGRTVILTPTQR
jgi:hypothetical protein